MKKLFHGLSFRWQIIPIIALALSDLAIFAFPSYLSNFLPNLQASMGIADSQLSLIRSIYGAIKIFLYIFAMSFADKFKCKTLILIGIFGMFLTGIWYSLIPIIWPNPNPTADVYSINFYNYLFVFILIAIFTGLFFWSPLWKLVAMQGKREQVGTMNGLEGSFNGFFGSLIAIIGTVFFFIDPQVGHIHVGFLVLTSCYSLVLLCSFFAVLKFVHEDQRDVSDFNFIGNIKACFGNAKSPKLWLYAVSVMGVYMYQMALSGYTDYMRNVFLFSAVVVFFLGLGKTYLMRFISSYFMGRFADKKNHYILYIFWGLVISSALTLMVICLPGFSNNFKIQTKAWYFTPIQILAGINMVALGFSAWCLVTIRWSAIATELKIHEKQYSGAVAFVSFIAFLPDAFFQIVKSEIQSHHQTYYSWLHKQATDQLGNQYILLFSLAIGLIGLLSGYILWFWVYRMPNQEFFTGLSKKINRLILSFKSHKKPSTLNFYIKSNNFFISSIFYPIFLQNSKDLFKFKQLS